MAEEEDVAVLVDVEVDVRDRVGVAEGQSCCWFMTSSPMGPSSKDPSFMDSATQATEGSHTPISGLAVPLAYVARARGMLENLEGGMGGGLRTVHVDTKQYALRLLVPKHAATHTPQPAPHW